MRNGDWAAFDRYSY